MNRRDCLAAVLVWVVFTWLMNGALSVNASGREDFQGATSSTNSTVWDGVYTEKQAERGKTQYTQACASCHADDLRGKSTAPSLVEESFAFLWDDATVGELLERTRMLMPSDRPNSLPAATYRDIVAFILQSNKFPPGEKELDAEAAKLKQILITSKKPDGK